MVPDILKNGFEAETLTLKNDEEGEVVATLVRKESLLSSKKAALYIHGFIDYFFQAEMADKFNEQGFNFYALDMRKYGRSLLPHQTPNYCQDISEYFEEIDKSIEFISNDGNEKILLIGHSTGGLISSIYLSESKYKDHIDALFLNSPFFDFNEPWIKKIIALNLIKLIGGLFPKMRIPGGLSSLYGQSLHKNYNGEWDYNLTWKPINGFPIKAGWLKAIFSAHKMLHSGLDIKCPILIMYSHQSSKLRKWNSILLRSDAVLDVMDIEKISTMLGRNITKIPILDGIHDLVLSSKDIREDVYKKLFTWINAYIK